MSNETWSFNPLSYIPFFQFGSVILGSITTVIGIKTASKVTNLVNRVTVFEATIDMTEQAKQGKLRRAWGRQREVGQLAVAVSKGFVVLVGDSGVGKTALVEELACRVANNEIPSLRGAKIIRFNLRKAQGGAGAQAVLQNLWFGGVENKVGQMIEVLEQLNRTNKATILFIDEIYDLLYANVGMFDKFRDVLDRGYVKIIGATTNESIIHSLRSRPGTGEGMLRRVQQINVPAMTPAETEQMLTEQFRETPPHGFSFQAGVEKALVALSQEEYPKRMFPDRAISFLEDICGYYRNTEPDKNTIASEDVVNYYAQHKKQDVSQVNSRLALGAREAFNDATFSTTFFKPLERVTSSPDFVEKEAKRLEVFFHGQNDEPWLVLQEESPTFLQLLASYWVKDHRPVYRCNLRELNRLANTSVGKELLKEYLVRNFMHKVNLPILILEEYNPDWLRSHESDSVSTNFSQGAEVIDQVVDRISTGLVATMSNGHSAVPDRKEPGIVDDLLKFIIRERIPAVVLDKKKKVVPTSSDPWKVRPTTPLTFAQMFEWLEFRFKERSGNQHQDCQWIRKTLLTLYYLHDHNLKHAPLEMAARVIDLQAENNQSHDSLSSVLDGCRTTTQISDAWRDAQSHLEGELLTKIGYRAEVNPPASLEAQWLRTLHASQYAVLLIEEESKVRQQSILSQIATLQRDFYQLNAQLFTQMPPALKALAINEALNSIPEGSAIVLDGAAIANPTIVQALRKKRCKIVSFVTAQVPSGERSEGLSHLVDRGVQVFQEIRTSVQGSQSTPFELEIRYKPSALMEPEVRSFIQKALPQSVQGPTRLALLNLYLLLLKPPYEMLDATVVQIGLDQNLHVSSSVDALCKAFHAKYGADLQMSLQRIQFEADPSSVNWSYRFYRAAVSQVSTPFQQGSRLWGVTKSLLGAYFLNKVTGWARRVVGI